MNESEKERYGRQIAIEGFGTEAQEKLAAARVAIAGAGGLGCAVSAYLAACGVGWLRIADHGLVETSNLNRQVLYTGADVGRPKAAVIGARLSSMNPHVRVEPRHLLLDEHSAESLVEGCDLVIDALDNVPARLALNRAVVLRRLPLVHGAIHGFAGQLMTVLPGRTACLMCLYGDRKITNAVPVIGVAPGTIGLLQATEAIKQLAGIGRALAGILLLFDGLEMSFTEIALVRDPRCPHCGNPDQGS